MLKPSHDGETPGNLTYRGGSATDQNLTPRFPQDVVGDKRGLSTFSNPAQVERSGYKKAQEIDTARLANLDAIPNGTGAKDSHVSIRPSSELELVEWAQSREKGGHEYTKAVKAAIVREVRLPLEQSGPRGASDAPPVSDGEYDGGGGSSGGGGATSSW